MKSHLYSLVKFIIGLPLTFLALFFIIKLIIGQATTLSNNIHSIHIFLLIYGILSFVIFYFVRSYIWYLILKNYHYIIFFKESNYLWAISNLKRYIPGNIWSFLTAAVLFEKKGIKKKDIGKSFIIEAELFVLGSAILSLLALSFYFSHNQFFEKFAISFLVLLAAIIFCYGNKLIYFLPERFRRIVIFLFPSFSITENAFLIWLSMIALFFFGLGNYLVITSVIYLSPTLY